MAGSVTANTHTYLKFLVYLFWEPEQEIGYDSYSPVISLGSRLINLHKLDTYNKYI